MFLHSLATRGPARCAAFLTLLLLLIAAPSAAYASAMERRSDCSGATLSSDYRLHLPVINYQSETGPASLRADFVFVPGGAAPMFELTGHGAADTAGACGAANLDKDFRLNVPELIFGELSLNVDLRLKPGDGSILFELEDYSINEPDQPGAATPLRIELGEGSRAFTHPVIYNNHLYVLSEVWEKEDITFDFGGGEGGTIPIPVYRLDLSCFDLKDNLKLKWKTRITDHAKKGDARNWNQVNLIVAMDRIVVDSSIMTGEYLDGEQRRIALVDPSTGDITREMTNVESWSFNDCEGEPTIRSTGNSSSNGMLLESGGDLLFAESAFGISVCSGLITHTGWDGNWKMHSTPIYMGSRLFTGTSDFKAVDTRRATNGLRGCDVSGTIYEIPFSANGAEDVSLPVIDGARILFTYVKEADDRLYFGSFDVNDGSLVSEKALLPPGEFTEYGSTEQPVLSGSRLVIPLAGETLIFDVDSETLIARVDPGDIRPGVDSWAGLPWVVTEENLFMVRPECVKGCDTGNDVGYNFYIDKIDLATGNSVGRIDSPFLSGAEEFRFSGESLFHNGNFIIHIVSETNRAGMDNPAILSIPVGDTSAEKLQYRYGNDGNCVAAPRKGDAAGPGDAPDDGDDPVALPASAPTEDLSVDTPPGEEVVYPDLFDRESLFSAYVPLLTRVTFNTDGEPKPTGEGAVIVRGNLSCPDSGACCPRDISSKLYYPFGTYLPLDEYTQVKEGMEQKPYLTFQPHIPIYYSLWESIENDENRKMMFSYQAYEHDNQSALDYVVDNIDDVIQLGASIFTGDICGIITSALSMGESALESVDENFGSPFVYLVKESGGEGNIFGIPEEERARTFTMGASDNPDDMQTAVGAASDAADLVCAAMSITKLATNPDVVTSMVNTGAASGRVTEGDVSLNRRLLIPTNKLSVSLDRMESDFPWPIGNLFFRVGVLGEDYPESSPDKSAGTDNTPFVSYVKSGLSSLSGSLEEKADTTLYQAEFSVNRGLAGVYVEVGLEGGNAMFSMPAGVYSGTKFFDEILYGAWDRDPEEERTFTKTVKKRIASPHGEAYLHLTYRVELGE